MYFRFFMKKYFLMFIHRFFFERNFFSCILGSHIYKDFQVNGQEQMWDFFSIDKFFGRFLNISLNFWVARLSSQALPVVQASSQHYPWRLCKRRDRHSATVRRPSRTNQTPVKWWYFWAEFSTLVWTSGQHHRTTRHFLSFKLQANIAIEGCKWGAQAERARHQLNNDFLGTIVQP